MRRAYSMARGVRVDGYIAVAFIGLFVVSVSFSLLILVLNVIFGML